MGEPFSAAAGAIGIIATALEGTRLLLRDIDNISQAPKVVAGLKEDVRGAEMAIEGLKAIEPTDLESLGVAEQQLSAIKTCSKACDTFRNDLQRWTKHSENGNLSRRDRFNVGYFQAEKIKSLSTQLLNCKTTLILAASTATLHSSIRHSGMTKEIQKNVATSEFGIAAAIKTREVQITEVKERLQVVSLADPGQDRVELEERDAALKQIEEERKALSESQELLEALLAKTKDRSGISVKNIRTSDNGQLATGLINTEGRYVGASVTIENVEATSGGQGIVGIADGVPFDKFFK